MPYFPSLLVAALMALLATVVGGVPVDSRNPVPFLCQTDVHETLSQMALQTTHCAQGDANCGTQFTVRAKSHESTKPQLDGVGWDSPPALDEPSVPCGDCHAVLEHINSFCQSSNAQSKKALPAFLDQCSQLHMDDARETCRAVYQGVAALFCPIDPCTEIKRSIQSSADTICRSSAVNCDRHLHTAAPLQPLTHPSFQPTHPFPPLACTDYVKRTQRACQDNHLPQYQFCSDLEGFEKNGCDFFMEKLVEQSHDVCAPLFAFDGLTQRMGPRDSVEVCLGLQLADQSPIACPEWVAYKNAKRGVEKKVTESNTTTSSNTTAEATEGGVASSSDGHTASPCIAKPSPSPNSPAIVKVLPQTPGFRTSLRGDKRIRFSCDMTTYWADVTPRIGCGFKPFSLRLAGEPEYSSQAPCTCTCSSHVSECGAGPGTVVSWSDVSTPENCAHMMCSKQGFEQCAWRGLPVATNSFWNGNSVTFDSPVLQDTCQGTATVEDFCGVLVSGKVNKPSSRLMRWILRNDANQIIADSGSGKGDFGEVSDLAVNNMWLPCGLYSLELADHSLNANGWADTSLELRDGDGFLMVRGGHVQGSLGVPTEFRVSAKSIADARAGLCSACAGGVALPCYTPVQGGLPMCSPFTEGTSECPPGTLPCK